MHFFEDCIWSKFINSVVSFEAFIMHPLPVSSALLKIGGNIIPVHLFILLTHKNVGETVTAKIFLS